MGWMTIVDAAATPLAGRIGDRRRAHGWVAAISLVFVIIGLLVIAPRLGVVGLVSGLAIVGLGSAGLGPSLLVVMGSIVPRERSGAAVGVMQLCGDVGGMLGPLVGTAILAGGSAYVAAAVLLALMLPLAINLAREEASPPESETLT